MVGVEESVKQGISEVRTTILGAQLLLGFQYRALLQKHFLQLPPARQGWELVGFPLLLLVLVLMIAPASHHRIAERGESTGRQVRYTGAMMSASLALFALGIGAAVVTGAADRLGGLAYVIAGVAVVAALTSWFGVELMVQTPKRAEAPQPAGPTPLRKKIDELLEETRVVLPGVQALLGFQLAGYFAEGFEKAPPDAKAAHTLALVLLLASMILLMTPAPFHRIAERGEATPRADRVGTAFVLAGLALLGFGVCADLYVVVRVVAGSAALASCSALAALVVAFGVWFLFPALRRQRKPVARSA